MTRRRVVITGVGMVTPLGIDTDSTWENILASKSGITNLVDERFANHATKIAGLIPGNFDILTYVAVREVKKMDPFMHYGIAAAAQAIDDSKWTPLTDHEKNRTGVIVGSGIGGLAAIENATLQLAKGERISPFFIPSCLNNLLPGRISMMNGYTGPNHSIISACATSANAIYDAYNMIKYDICDVIISGGAEACVTPVGIAGFNACRALSTSFNDRPSAASRPWDKGRDGFVMSEGAAMVVIEEYEHAINRGAKIYGEIVGCGSASDAYDITAPHPEGIGAKNAIQIALDQAGISCNQIDYINAHGTSTPVGDAIELNVIQSLFIDNLHRVKMSSTKSSIGHLIGAAGSMEAIFCLLAMRDSMVPPTLNLDNPIDEVAIDLVKHKAIKHIVNYAMTNSLGFGGTNISIILKKLNQ